jgi:hypothetical protein
MSATILFNINNKFAFWFIGKLTQNNNAYGYLHVKTALNYQQITVNNH